MERFRIEWFDRQIEQAHAEMLVKLDAERQAGIARSNAEQRQFDTAQVEFKRIVHRHD